MFKAFKAKEYFHFHTHKETCILHFRKQESIYKAKKLCNILIASKKSETAKIPLNPKYEVPWVHSSSRALTACAGSQHWCGTAAQAWMTWLWKAGGWEGAVRSPFGGLLASPGNSAQAPSVTLSRGTWCTQVRHLSRSGTCLVSSGAAPSCWGHCQGTALLTLLQHRAQWDPYSSLPSWWLSFPYRAACSGCSPCCTDPCAVHRIPHEPARASICLIPRSLNKRYIVKT